jgi:hypothetical protein
MNNVAKGREKSDGRVVAQGRVMAAPTAETRGAKAITASNRADQLNLFARTAENPSGSVGGAVSGRPDSVPCAVPKLASAKVNDLPAMTMEEVASEVNLKRAFE